MDSKNQDTNGGESGIKDKKDIAASKCAMVTHEKDQSGDRENLEVLRKNDTKKHEGLMKNVAGRCSFHGGVDREMCGCKKEDERRSLCGRGCKEGDEGWTGKSEKMRADDVKETSPEKRVVSSPSEDHPELKVSSVMDVDMINQELMSELKFRSKEAGGEESDRENTDCGLSDGTCFTNLDELDARMYELRVGNTGNEGDEAEMEIETRPRKVQKALSLRMKETCDKPMHQSGEQNPRNQDLLEKKSTDGLIRINESREEMVKEKKDEAIALGIEFSRLLVEFMFLSSDSEVTLERFHMFLGTLQSGYGNDPVVRRIITLESMIEEAVRENGNRRKVRRSVKHLMPSERYQINMLVGQFSEEVQGLRHASTYLHRSVWKILDPEELSAIDAALRQCKQVLKVMQGGFNVLKSMSPSSANASEEIQLSVATMDAKIVQLWQTLFVREGGTKRERS